MIIDIDKKLNLINITMENSSIDNTLKNILQTQGWNLDSSSINFSQQFATIDNLIEILKQLDVPADGIDSILIEHGYK